MPLMRTSLSELAGFAKRFVDELPKIPAREAHVIGFKGDLGAGKTTFVKLVAKELGVDATVHSPTFTLLQSYAIEREPFKKLIHIDAYRLTSGDTDTIGWRACIADPENLILVEWPENIPGGFPKEFSIIEFSVVDEHTRNVVRYCNE